MFKLLRYVFRWYSLKTSFRYFGTLKRRMSFLRQGLILFFALRDSRTPTFVRLMILGALGYLLSPTDMIPDIIAGLGWLDDAAVIAGAMKIAQQYIRPEHVLKAKKFFPG